jgi:hypothetical protein
MHGLGSAAGGLHIAKMPVVSISGDVAEKSKGKRAINEERPSTDGRKANLAEHA